MKGLFLIMPRYYSVAESAKVGGDIGWINEASLNNQIKQKFIEGGPGFMGIVSKPIV